MNKPANDRTYLDVNQNLLKVTNTLTYSNKIMDFQEKKEAHKYPGRKGQCPKVVTKTRLTSNFLPQALDSR